MWHIRSCDYFYVSLVSWVRFLTQTWSQELHSKWFIWNVIPIKPIRGMGSEARMGEKQEARVWSSWDFGETMWNVLQVIYPWTKKKIGNSHPLTSSAQG